MRASFKGTKAMVLLGVCVLAMSAFAGCHSDKSEPLSTTQTQSANRLADITKKSGGDWEKVSPEDRDYILKNLAYGNERTARMLIAPPPGKAGAGGPTGLPQGSNGQPADGIAEQVRTHRDAIAMLRINCFLHARALVLSVATISTLGWCSVSLAQQKPAQAPASPTHAFQVKQNEGSWWPGCARRSVIFLIRCLLRNRR